MKKLVPFIAMAFIGCSHGSAAPAAAPMAAPPPPPANIASANRSPGQEACSGMSILFDEGDSTLNAAASAQVHKLADCVKGNDAHEVIISGAGDKKGDRAANDLLAQRRAETVLAELRKMGVSDLDIIIKGEADEGTSQSRILWPYERKVEVEVKKAS